MELTHSFGVPTPVGDTWEHFQDLGALAECFPGAQLTESDGETFSGTVKVKLGPIALVYTGTGRYVEREPAAHRFVVDAKGRDKRGNGTAGAVATVTMTDVDGATRVDVHTDLSITGKPAQFGRGLIQEVSDKLLAQFVACLQQRLTAPEAEAADDGAAPAEVHNGPTVDAAPSAAAPAAPVSRPAVEPDDTLDLGATVLPVLLRRYAKPALAGLAALAVVVWLVRRLS